MLSSYSHQKNILQSANNLLANSVLYNVIELKKLNSKGCRLTLYKCDYCEKLFNHINDEPIFAFFCGHKFHLRCCSFSDSNQNEDVSCEICKKNEFDYVSSFNRNGSLIDQNATKTTNLEKEPAAEMSQGRRGRYEHLFSRLKEIDKLCLEKELLINHVK